MLIWSCFIRSSTRGSRSARLIRGGIARSVPEAGRYPACSRSSRRPGLQEKVPLHPLGKTAKSH